MNRSGRNHPHTPEPVVNSLGEFSPSWLQGKSVAPVPVGSHIDAGLTQRIASGCRAVGATYLFCESLETVADGPGGDLKRLPVDSGHQGIRPPSVLYTPERQGAVLYREPGYALIAGDNRFMAAAVGEGVDTSRVRFERYARALSSRHPTLTVVAQAYRPTHTAWSHPADIAPGGGAARQLVLLDEFVDGARSAGEFAQGWWDARRTSQQNGERIKAPLADLFDRVFMILEDYAADPDLREPGDLTDEELHAAIQELRDIFRESLAE